MTLCSGAFDGLHSGHVAYLEAAKALAPDEPLWVAVAPDAYIHGAKYRPARWTQQDRAETVAALRVVDCVIVQDEASVAATIRETRPARFVKGEDWCGRIPSDVAAACVETGADLAFVGTTRTHCSEAFWTDLGNSL